MANGTAGGAPGARNHRGRSLGCLGWLLIVAGTAVLAVVAAIIGTWAALPTLVAPEDPDWEMTPPDPERSEEVQDALESALDQAQDEGFGEVRLSQEDLDLLLAWAMERWQPEDIPLEDRPRSRFRVEGGTVALEVVGQVPEDARRIPGRLRSEMAGLSLEVRPRAAGDALALTVEGAYMGRIPLPVGLAMGLLPHIPLDPDVGFLDPGRSEILVPLEPLAGVSALPEGVRLDQVTVEEGGLVLTFGSPAS